MSMPIKTIILFAAVLVWMPAKAQFLGLGFKSYIELTKQDLAIIRQTVDRNIHGKSVGTTASWHNPESKNYGEIKLLRRYVRQSHTCETLEYTIGTKNLPVSPEHYTLSGCRQPDGTWKIT